MSAKNIREKKTHRPPSIHNGAMGVKKYGGIAHELVDQEKK